VDDSPTVRRQLTVAFDRLGLACETVDSAGRALERLADEHFDLALVDVVMPDWDGYKLTREIKRNKRLRQMPVIILTSRSSPFDLARGALSGCDAYLTKPVPFRALESAVVKQFRRSIGAEELARMMRVSDSEALRMDQKPESRVARLFRR
jgi:twitching motility two-component system response regulator PilG